MRLIILALTICFCSCSLTPKIPDPPQIVEVKVSVPVNCLGPLPIKPDLISDASLVLLNPGSFVTALHIDRLMRDMYMAELEVAIEGCKSLQAFNLNFVKTSSF
jgi:hypothetical protein